MKVTTIKITVLLLVVVTFQSCLNVANDVKSWIELNAEDEIFGKYHMLEDDGIKIYLPDVFKRYSSVEYQQLLDSLATKKDYEYESKRLKSMRELEGNLYLYFDETTRSTYSINTMPYMPLYKRDAQYLLGMIRLGNERVAENTDLKFTKITAKYNASNGPQIFKVVHRIDNEAKQTSTFSTTYIISSNHKTVFINLTTPFDAYFDPFLQKMIL